MPVDGSLNPPSLTADVTNTRSPHTIGDDQPRPGTSTAHATFCVADHLTGNCAASATPAAFGPRNCGQSVGPIASGAPAIITRRVNRDNRVFCITSLLDVRRPAAVAA